MGAPPSLHPTDQTLQAYGLGTLGEDASASVDSHLAECSACRQRAAEMSGDSFLGRLREAHGDAGTKGGSSSMAGAKRRASSSVSDDGPPRELVDHPDYEVVRELGRGGMGVVYLANNTLMGRMEVLKVVGSHLVKRQGVLDRFLREIRSAAKLHHPNIVGAYAAMRLGDCVVLAMEYVEGEDLAQLVKARGALPVTNACYFTYQAALGLQHAHERGMVHRDIKPANLILAREGKKAIVKVLDFGLAKATSEGQLDSGLTHEGQMLGTPDFIAPEQIVDAQRADIRADVYSLGCTLYYLLSGGAPFRATSLYELLQAHHSMDAPALNMVRPEVPTELAALVAKMMAKDPARRFQTPGEVAQALTKFFKPGAQPSSTSNAEVPRAVPPVPAPPPTIPATDLGAPALPPVSKKLPSKPGPEGVAWESLIEFKQTEPPTLAIKPKPPEPEPAEAEGKPPRNWWPIIAAASAAGSIALGIIIYITTDGRTTKVTVPSGTPVKVDGAGKVDVGGVIIEAISSGPGQPETSASATKDVGNARAKPAAIVTAGPAPEIRGGVWKVIGDELSQSTLDRGATLAFGDPTWSHYNFKFRAVSTGGTHGFKAKFHWTGAGNACEFAVGNYFNAVSDVSFESGGRWGRQDGMYKKGPVELLRWYDVRIEVRGPEFRCFLDNALIFQGRYDEFTSGRVGLATWDNTARFSDIEVTSPDGKTLWRGLPPPSSATVAAVAPGGAIDYFGAGSIWMGTRTYRKGAGAGRPVAFELKVTERNGDKFTGYAVDDGRSRTDVEGDVDGASIAWRERADRNSNQVLRTRGTLSGNTISLTFDNNYTGAMSKSGDGELSWAGGGTESVQGGTPEYVPVFNGKDITEWSAWGKQRLMSAEETRPVWTVRDGDLIGSGEFSHLFSPRGDYTDFRVRAMVKINEGGNSGLYFRAQKGPGYPQGYEAQINATHRDVSKTGSLYKAGHGAIRTVAASPVPSNTWFTLEAEAVGDHIRVWVDGKPTADWIDPQRTYDTGHFAIQVHDPHTQVQVRKLEVMDLSPSAKPSAVVAPPAKPPAPVTGAAERGFQRLFNGKDLDGWKLDHEPGRWSVRGGQIITTGTGGPRNQSFLLSTQDFSDFVLRFEVALAQGTDSGVVFRADPTTMPTCLQVNLTNISNSPFPTGSLRWKKDDADYMRPTGQPEGGPYGSWSKVEIEARGDIVSVTYNNREVFRQDLSKLADRPEAMPGLMRRSGRIGFQSHTGTAGFKNIQIKELDPPAQDATGGTGGLPTGASKPLPALVGKPPVPPDADLSEKLAPEIRSVPTRPGGLKVASGPPDAFSPNLTPDDTENWRVGDASLVEMSGKGLVISGGTAGNFFVTRRSDYKKCTITVDLSATEGTDAYLVLRGNEGPDGWRGVTSRVVDKGGKIHSGLQSLDFAEPELGGVLAAGDPRAEVLPRTNTRVTFSIDEKNAATVTSKLRKTTVAHDGPRRLDAAGAAGLFVRKGSVTVRSVRVEE